MRFFNASCKKTTTGGESAFCGGLIDCTDDHRSWTMHANCDGLAYPSYRMLPALRLACLEDDELRSKSPSGRVSAWKRQVAGNESWEGPEDCEKGRWERGMRDLLKGICDWISERAEKGLLATEAVRDRLEREGKRDGSENYRYRYGLRCIWLLWDEELQVAQGVRASIDDGISFW